MSSASLPQRHAVAALLAAALAVGCAAPQKTRSARPAPAAAPAAEPEKPRTPQERYAAALEHMRNSRWSEAEAELVPLVRQYPKFSGPHTNLGIVYARTNRKDRARVAFTYALSANPKNAAAHNWQGILAREAGDHAAAERAYRQAIAADPKYAEAHLNLAILYDEYLKQPAPALAAYRRYQALLGDKADLRTAVWIAELEKEIRPASAAPAPAASPPAAKAPAGRAAPARKK